MNKEQTTQILLVLRTIWPNTPIDDNTITAYMWALDGVPMEQVDAAAQQWVKTGKFFPKPSELLEIIAVATAAPDVLPEAVWGEVMREVRRVGYKPLPVYRNGEQLPPPAPKFSSPLIAQAVEAIGWRDLCLTDDDDMPTVRAQFRKALEAIKNQAVRQVQIGSGPAVPMLDEPKRTALDAEVA